MDLSIFSNLRIRLTLLISLSMFPVLGLTLYSHLQERSSAISNMREDVYRLAQFSAGSQEQFIESTRQLVKALSKTEVVQSSNISVCSSVFTEILDEYPEYLNLGAAYPDGQVFCSAIPIQDGVDFRNKPWFLGVIEHKDFSMGVCDDCCATGRATLNINYPVLDGEGRVKAVVFAAMDLDQINRLTARVRMPRGTELMMISRTGTIMAYSYQSEQWFSKTGNDLPLVRAVLGKGEDIAELNGLDGILRLFAFTPLSKTVDTGMYVCVGIPVADAHKAVNRHLIEHLAGMVIIASLAIVAVWMGSNALVLRPVRVLATTAEQLSQGDMRARTGLQYGTGELGRLARAFDEMAEILERRAVQLRQAEAKYRTLVEQLPAITYIARMDELRSILYISPQIEAMLGFSSSDWVSDPQAWFKQIHPDDRQRVVLELSQGLAKPKPGFRAEYRVFSSTGALYWFYDEAVGVQDESGAFRYLQGIMRDVTEQRQAEEKLMTYQKQLRSLASQLSLAEERERRRIATELHDRVGQALAISKIRLGLIKEALHSTEFGPALEEVRKFIESAIQDTRTLIFKISSPILYELGLESALEWLVEQVQKQHGITCSFDDDGQLKPLDDDIRVLLFQAVNELLINVVKHANATHARVLSRKTGHCIQISVVDDGAGFNPSDIDFRSGQKGGFGLFSIRERLNYVEGRIEINSSPGKGTEVTLIAPLRKDDESEELC